MRGLIRTLILTSCALLCGCAGSDGAPQVKALALAGEAFEAGDWAKVASLCRGAGDSPVSFLLAGKALFFSGDLAGAETMLRRAVREGTAGGSLEARLFLIRALRAGEKQGEARSLSAALLSDAGEEPRALRLSGQLALDGGDSALALELLNRAVVAGGELGLVHLDRARLRWAAGDRGGSLSDIERALSLLPEGGAASGSARALKKALEGALR